VVYETVYTVIETCQICSFMLIEVYVITRSISRIGLISHLIRPVYTFFDNLIQTWIAFTDYLQFNKSSNLRHGLSVEGLKLISHGNRPVVLVPWQPICLPLHFDLQIQMTTKAY